MVKWGVSSNASCSSSSSTSPTLSILLFPGTPIDHWGTFCYIVIPFGLKDVGATYQRTSTTFLHDMMHTEVQVYVNHMIVKSKDRAEHNIALEKFFMRLRKYNMRLNPQKCAFGVTSGILLGYVISSRGIKIDSTIIIAIMTMPPHKNEKQLRGFLGKIQYINICLYLN